MCGGDRCERKKQESPKAQWPIGTKESSEELSQVTTAGAQQSVELISELAFEPVAFPLSLLGLVRPLHGSAGAESSALPDFLFFFAASSGSLAGTTSIFRNMFMS